MNITISIISLLPFRRLLSGINNGIVVFLKSVEYFNLLEIDNFILIFDVYHFKSLILPSIRYANADCSKMIQVCNKVWISVGNVFVQNVFIA